MSGRQFTHFWRICDAKTIYAFCTRNCSNRQVLTFCVSAGLPFRDASSLRSCWISGGKISKRGREVISHLKTNIESLFPHCAEYGKRICYIFESLNLRHWPGGIGISPHSSWILLQYSALIFCQYQFHRFLHFSQFEIGLFVICSSSASYGQSIWQIVLF